MFEIRRYRTATSKEPFTEWLSSLRDRQAQARILVRLERLELGNFGDCKFLRDGVSEFLSSCISPTKTADHSVIAGRISQVRGE